MELQKILTIFTNIDLSRNNFQGLVPEEFGQFQALFILNLSNNALSGKIPLSIGNLKNLESLDLSWNNLSRTIPTSLQKLNFLSFFNVSFNQLVGRIPEGSQLQTFSADSRIMWIPIGEKLHKQSELTKTEEFKCQVERDRLESDLGFGWICVWFRTCRLAACVLQEMEETILREC